mmetsp:Transcript_82676/g.229419  ORF Transcript_82676/g.229419 Transcript_82676/m.229419 type:complete len:280 (-) Transcript_82676:964-1803(-)
MARGRVRLHLVQVQVHVAGGCEDQPGTELLHILPVGLGAPVAPPHCQHVLRRLVILQAEMCLVPSNGRLPQTRQEPVHFVHHVALKARAAVEAELLSRRGTELLLQGLCNLRGIGLVTELVGLVTTHVEVAAREKARYLLDRTKDVGQHILRGHDDAVCAAHAVRRRLQRLRPLLVRAALVQLHNTEICLLAPGRNDEGGGVGGHVDLRHHLYLQCRCEGHELLHLRLAEKARSGVACSVVDLLPVPVALWPVEAGAAGAADERELRPALHLHPPALVI